MRTIGCCAWGIPTCYRAAALRQLCSCWHGVSETASRLEQAELRTRDGNV
ncbi:putative signal peptide protein [Puccinia sorghi]|uniref:Putative signal peptide protein n=1 Tax=Puccinia sorghi TaxID=27349 RepID=A0A0L6VHC8_9BASI|nr:putative signal peptide protein [Puccinia sorghi]